MTATATGLVVDAWYYDYRDLEERHGLVERLDDLACWGPMKAGVLDRLITEMGQNRKPWSRITRKHDDKRLASAARCTVRLVRELRGGQSNKVQGVRVYQPRRVSKIRAILRVLRYSEAEFLELVRAAAAR